MNTTRCFACETEFPITDESCPACGKENGQRQQFASEETAAETPAPPAPAADPHRLAEFRQTLIGLTPRVWATQLLFGVNVLVFIIMAASGVSMTDPTVAEILAWGANFGPRTVNGEWWRLCTCIFVHISIMHLLINMLILVLVGPLVERMVGNVGFLLLYLVSGLIGALGSLCWDPMLVSAGATGAIFGIWGALLGLLVRSHGSIPAPTAAKLRSSGLTFLIYNLIDAMLRPNIDVGDYIGGMAAGFFCGLVLSQPMTPTALPGRPFRNLCVSFLGAFLVLVGIFGVHEMHADLADLGVRIEFDSVEIYYGNGATKAEAERLAAYLIKAWGAQGCPASMQLKKTPNGYQVRMVVSKEFAKDAGNGKRFEFQGTRISRDVFDGAGLELHLCDERLKTLKALPLRADIRHGIIQDRVELFYAADIKKADAERLAKYLAQTWKDTKTEVAYKLAVRGDVKEVHMILRQDALQDRATKAELRRHRDEISVNVFDGAKVEIHACDDLMNPVGVIVP